tara:strand:- start:993 stop:1523 length:531 start_codon:yes stop_codon:yes gene_type:complete
MKNKAFVLWFTGLSGSGKTSIAKSIKLIVEDQGKKVLILDGDKIRDKKHKDLGFSPRDIKLNNSLIAELCLKNIYKYDLILVPIISPFRDSRFHAKELLGNRFKEVYIQASIETLEKRDTKGLYRQQKNGLIDNLIGVSNKNPYELPKNPDLIINTDKLSLKESSERLKKFISKLI